MKRTFSAFGWMFLAGIALLSSCTTDDEDLFPENTDKSQTKITLKLKVKQANQLKNIAFPVSYDSVMFSGKSSLNVCATSNFPLTLFNTAGNKFTLCALAFFPEQ